MLNAHRNEDVHGIAFAGKDIEHVARDQVKKVI